MEFDFENIRPYNADELKPALERLFSNEQFRALLPRLLPNVPVDLVAQMATQVNTPSQFQAQFVKPILDQFSAKLVKSFTYSGLEKSDEPYLYITNHRDIVVDPALLDYAQFQVGNDTVEIGIGDNLLSLPWVYELVRINKCFIVQRSLPRGEQVRAFMQLSAYIRHAICEKKTSVWIAQREGRAKDSNDRTQESILKMFALSGEGSFIENLKALNIRPVSISYEFDPCDYLKAKEFQQKRDDAEFKKSAGDDVLSMRAGITGYKGRVHYAYTPCINDELDAIAATLLGRKEQVEAVAALIDKRIHANYVIYPINRVAYAQLTGDNSVLEACSEDERTAAAAYLEQRLAMVELPNKDEAFLRTKLLEMYANPFKNYLATR